MTHADFCTWLAGYLTDREKPDADVIRKKLGEVKEPAPFDWGKIGAPDFGLLPARLTSGDPMPIYHYTTCGSAGMTRPGVEFESAISTNTEALYEN